jgi:two-component system, response regulator PdtaR
VGLGTPSEGLCGTDVAVLIVEDEFLIALEIEDFLTRNGCRVIGPAPSVREALSLIEREPPEVAILDVNLRGEIVTPVAAALRDRHIPFLIASAYGSASLKDNPALRGAVNLGKPMRPDRLLCEIARLVGAEPDA